MRTAVNAVRQEFGRVMAFGPRFEKQKAIANQHVVMAVLFGAAAVFVAASVLFANTSWALVLPFVAALAYGAVVQIKRARKAHQSLVRFERLVQVGVPIDVFLIQANNLLFKPGNRSLPCLVLFSFQDPTAENAVYLEDLANRTFALKETRQADPDLAAIARFTTDERAILDRRRAFPLSFTGGRQVFCADLWIDQMFLPQAHLSGRLLMCLAEPGMIGSIEMLPP